MDRKTTLILGVFGVIAIIAYFFLQNQQSNKVVSNSITTSNTTGLAALLDTKAGSQILGIVTNPASVVSPSGAGSSAAAAAINTPAAQTPAPIPQVNQDQSSFMDPLANFWNGIS